MTDDRLDYLGMIDAHAWTGGSMTEDLLDYLSVIDDRLARIEQVITDAADALDGQTAVLAALTLVLEELRARLDALEHPSRRAQDAY
jgi:hypothetical protein